MKKKLKKLALNTETLRTLTEPAIKEAVGGLTLGCTSDATRMCSLCTVACSACCP